jgi:hypothetical protein
MSRPSPSAPSIPLLIEQLSSTDASVVADALGSVARAAARNDRDALRLAQGGAVPAFVRALQGPDEQVAKYAAGGLAGAARVAPDLVLEAAGSALVAALISRGDSFVAVNAAAVSHWAGSPRFAIGWPAICKRLGTRMRARMHTPAQRHTQQALKEIAEHNPSSVAAEPGALHMLASALRSTNDRVFCNAAATLGVCAQASPSLARLIAGTPGVEAALLSVLTSGDEDAGANAAGALNCIAEVDAEGIARLVSAAPAALPGLSALLQSTNAAAVRFSIREWRFQRFLLSRFVRACFCSVGLICVCCRRSGMTGPLTAPWARKPSRPLLPSSSAP